MVADVHRRVAPVHGLSASLLCTLLFAPCGMSAFTNLPRWGQATALVNSELFVHGGKTDEFNSFSYTSATTSNDFIHLDLSSGFNISSPPWQYLSGSQELSTPQGPVLAWHSLSAYSTSQLLVFGGDGGPNSPIVLPNQANSASLLDVSNITVPSWTSEAESWAGEPSRRIYHSTASTGGKIYIVGGEKDDGSGLGYSDHYVFDPSGPSFTQLPSTSGPPDIYGHSSVILSDGRLLVFGGYSQSQSQLIPFTTIWAMDTKQHSLSWTTLSVSNNTVPPSRRAFAAVWLTGDKVLIHGGADAQLQTSLSDGWILDTTTSPMTWSNISALTELGPRRDHFAVLVGSQVLFGFGYATNGPASVELSVFDLSQNALATTLSPPSSASSPTTLPAPSGTNSGDNPNDGPGASGITTGHGSKPTSPGGDNPDTNSEMSNKDKAAIALGSVFGFLALAAAITAVYVIYGRRNGASQRFRLLGDDMDSPPPPSSNRPGVFLGLPWMSSGRGEKARMAEPEGRSFLGIGTGLRRHATQGQQRVDMFADEDERQFNEFRAVRRDGSGSSASWYSIRNLHGRSWSDDNRQTVAFGALFGGSVSSLRSVGAMFGIRKVTGDGGSGFGMEEVGEKERLPLNPFSDSSGHLLGEAAGSAALASRPRGGQYQKSQEGSSYSDPFRDQDSDHGNDLLNVDTLAGEGEGDATDDHPQPRSAQSTLSRSSDLLALPPLLTVSSKSSSGGGQSPISAISAQGSNSESSHSSDVARHPRQRPSSIIGSSAMSHPVRRSDSWWSKLKRGPRRDSVTKPLPKPEFDFRDPNPAPKLTAIHEASLSTSESPESAHQHPQRPGLYSTAGMEKSTTSFKTNKTADSETIEKLGGRVAVVQRETTETSEYSPTTGTRSPEASGTWSTISEHPPPLALSHETDNVLAQDETQAMVESPVQEPLALPPLIEDTHSSGSSTARSSLTFEDALAKSRRRQSQGGGGVAARVAAYERRLTAESPSGLVPQPPGRVVSVLPAAVENRRKRPSISVKYGLAQQPQLFIANPDHHQTQSSSDSLV